MLIYYNAQRKVKGVWTVEMESIRSYSTLNT